MNRIALPHGKLFPLAFLFAICVAQLPMALLAAPPNVVILFTDDHGMLDAKCYGSDDLITPNIDRLADEGVRFTQAYAHSVCCPARAALMTGRHPQRTGISGWARGNRTGLDGAKFFMKPEEVTIAEVLKGSGYKTALFGKWHLGAAIGHGPLDQGFDRFFGHLGGFIDNYRHYFLHGHGYHDLWNGNEEIFRRGEYYPDMMVHEAVEYIEQNRDAPFFMYVAFNLPHYPEQPIEKFADAYADMPMPRQSYARVISSVDEHIGRILKKLDETGLADNTIVIMMGDNGYSAENKPGITVDNHASGFPKGHYYSANGGGGNTGKWIGHKGNFLEGGIRVPAIIRYPKALPSGEVRDQVVTVMDWFPTILELAEIPKPDEVAFDGRSVLPVVRDTKAPSAHDVLHFEWINSWAIRSGDWKLIGHQNNKKKGPPSYELRNLADAEPEAKNYAKELPEVVDRLAKLHEQWAEEIQATGLD
ncbi:sulfatase-like hydrolase/transferase [bacterium]|nr:sulfatase-like hydrolase/transferase [bacterium]